MSEINSITLPQDNSFAEFVATVRHHFYYNPDTGIFTWKVRTGGKSTVGKEVGYMNKNKGYLYTKIADRQISLHRLAWIYTHGENPEVIDHINGVTTDNRLCNLRNVTCMGNSQNQKKCKCNNKSGFLGVSKVKHNKTKPYAASIRVRGKAIFLGYFKTPEEAHEVHLKARREYYLCNTL